MTVFYLLAAALTMAVVVLILRPWWSFAPARRETISDTTLNVVVHRARLAELEEDLQTGALTAADFAAATTELYRELLEDTTAGNRLTAAAHRGSALLIAIFVPLFAGGLYAALGSPSAILPDRERALYLAQDMSQLAERLAQRLSRHPEDAPGWAMLARAYKELERWGDAERAFERAGRLVNADPALSAEYAEVLVLKERRFSDRSRALLKKSLALDPNNGLALFLGGTDAYEQGDLPGAEVLWGRLLPQLDPESEDARMLDANLARVRQLTPRTGERRSGASTRLPSARRDSGAPPRLQRPE